MLSSALSQKDEEIELVHRLGHKEQGLEAQIRDIQDEAPSRRIQDCKREERALEAEIREVETKLWGLKSRHGHLLREIEQLENGVQAKLSSYRAALVLAKGETKAFLQHRQGSGGGGSYYNAAVVTGGGGGGGGGKRGRGTKEVGIWTLPAERRTLAMADEHFREEQEDLRARRQAAEQERLALEEGGLVWRDVVAEVTAVEDMLRTEMHGPEAEGRTTREEQQQQQQPSLGNEEAHDEGGEREGEEQRRGKNGGSDGGRRRDHSDSTTRVLRRMQQAKTALGEHLATAERRRWRLLVCCVGAELEALAEGMEVLTGGWDGGGEEGLKRGWEEDDGGGCGGGEEDLKGGWEGDDDGGDDGEGCLKRGWEGDDDDDDDGEGAGVEGDPGSGGERSEKGVGEENVFESVDRHGGFAAWD